MKNNNSKNNRNQKQRANEKTSMNGPKPEQT